MICRCLFFCTLIGSALCLNAQSDSLSLLQAIAIDATYATADNLGNVYAITSDGMLRKYNRNGKLLSQFAQNQLGAPSMVDAANPMKILLWYSDFKVLVWLDRNLTQLGSLDLNQTDFPDAGPLCMGPDGNIWLYDNRAQRLRKISAEGQALYESASFNLLFDNSVNVKKILPCRQGICLLAENSQNLFFFDIYAQFSHAQGLRAPAIEFDCVSGALLYTDGVSLLRQLDNSPIESQMALPQSERCWLSASYLLVQYKGQLTVYATFP